MKIFQLPTNKKQWHIVKQISDRNISAICNCFGYYFGGYHNDKPEQTIENCKMKDWNIEEDNICPSCILQAYKSKIIKITI
jgi:hypothetical protein